MTTWVPTHAPNLSVIRPGSALSYSCAMHVDHPRDVTLTRLLFPRGSLIVAHPTALSTPHAWTLCDLDSSFTEYWNMAWKPPFSAHLLLFGLSRFEASTPRALMSSPPQLPLLASFLRHWPVLPVDPAFGVPPWLWSTSKSED